MKISFSTLACPNFSWTDIYSMAKDLGFDGIEIRGLGNEIFSVKAQPFTEAQLPKTVAKLKSLGLEIPCLTSGACLKFKDKFEEVKNEITEYAKLAGKLNTSYIRILGDLNPAPNGDVDDEYVSECLKKLVPIAEEYNVTLLVETNGVYSDTARLAKLLESVNSRKVAAL
ncbi:MAG TPA: AMP-dependent synthetase, partial [Ruminococcus sp.]|nr:AMP-dependent synthetase [Ruminococcus sp.]